MVSISTGQVTKDLKCHPYEFNLSIQAMGRSHFSFKQEMAWLGLFFGKLTPVSGKKKGERAKMKDKVNK